MRAAVKLAILTALAAPPLAAASGDAPPLPSVLDPRTLAADLIATLSWWMIGVFGLVFVLVMLIGGVGLGRRRALGDRASRNLVIAGGVVIPFAILLVLVIGSLLVGHRIDAGYSDAGLSVEIIGRRWWWEVRYRDRDDRVLAVTANEIHVPAGEPVRLLLRSEDVIHSFWAPNLDGKTDLIPGMTNVAWLRVAEPGLYRGQCAEFCGAQHALMGFRVIAQDPDAFYPWLEHQGQPARVAAGGPSAGARLFIDKGCAQCHSIRGTAADGAAGPDLTHVASRGTLAAATVANNRGYLGGWILDPQSTKPGALMPSTPLLPDEIEALLDYLQGLE